MKGKIEIPFIKMHGIGNDYIYIDSLTKATPFYLKEEFLPDLARKISDRHFGVGSDGLIVIQPSDIADFRMRIFNADGSEAKMCGNGVRCVGKYVFDLGFTDKKNIDIETLSGIKNLKLKIDKRGVESVIVNMGSPSFKKGDIGVKGNPEEMLVDHLMEASGKEYKLTAVSMGNPHGVVYVNETSKLDLSEIGPKLENDSIWEDRANIEFVNVKSPGEIEIRVWERGSGETMACGTGACASAVVSFRKGLTNPKVTVHLRGGDLKIDYDKEMNTVFMEGGAEFIAKGVFYYEYLGNDIEAIIKN